MPSFLRLVLLALVPAIGFAADTTLRGGDYHMHIRSQNGSAVWAGLCNAMPQACQPPMDKAPPPLAAEDAIRVLDDAGLDKGVIMSTAYFFGFPELTGSGFDSAGKVRAENQYVADQVARYPTRLTGLFSVNPLKEYAVDETRYWAEQGGLAGLKLHFANSNVDFANPEHISRLREVFEVLNQHALPVAIHLRNRNPEYGATDVETFINEVASKFPRVTIQFAHLVGWGGFDKNTDSAIDAVLQAFSDGRLDRSKVWFDIAAVIIKPLPDEAIPPALARIREIGLDRILFASDWDAIGTPAEHIEVLRSRLGLTESEWTQLISNRAPYCK